MRLSKQVRDIVDQMIQVDIVNTTDHESSMIKSDQREKLLKIYNEKVVAKYKPVVDAKFEGSIDKVLKNLEDYIVDQITKLTPPPSDTFIFTNLTAGELARQNPANRTEFKGELGKYHTALRALKDKKTKVWASLLHEGSTATEYGLHLRTLLAYYWLAASDAEMEFSDIYKEEVTSEEIRANFLLASIGNFIEVLAEIRRAHNEGVSKNILLDDPSCGPGTVGRALSRSSIYNKITALPPSTFEAIPESIHDYIVMCLQDASYATQQAVYNYINNKLMGDEVDDKDTNLYNEFLLAISQKAHLLKKLLKSQAHLKLDYPTLEKIFPLVIQILDIEKNVLMLGSGTLSDTTFIYRLLQTAVKRMHREDLLKALSEETIALRVSLFELSHEVNVLMRLIDNEIIRALLSTDYKNSTKFSEKAEIFLGFVHELMENLISLQKGYTLSAANEGAEITDKLVEDSVLPEKLFPKENVEGTILKSLPSSTQHRLSKLEHDLGTIISKLNAMLDNENGYELLAFEATLPRAPLQSRTEYHKGGVEQWALNILRLLFETEENGKFVRDEIEITRNINLIEKIFSPQERQEISQIVDNLLSRHDFKVFGKQVVFKLRKISLKELTVEGKKLFGEESFNYDIFPKSKIQLYRDSQFQMDDYSEWKSIALSMVRDQAKLKLFILLTYMNNLKVVQMDNEDAKTLNWLCDLYLSVGSTAHQSLFYPVTVFDDEISRINKLTGHLSCLLTNLKCLTGLVNSGSICLKSSTDAIELIKRAMMQRVPRPYLIRVSNSDPSSIVISATGLGSESHFVKEYKIALTELGSVTSVFNIEGRECHFSNAENLLSLIEGDNRLVTAVIGDLTVQKALSEDYKEQTRYKYMKTCKLVSIAETTNQMENRLYIKRGMLNPTEEKKAQDENNLIVVNDSQHYLVALYQKELVKSVPGLIQCNDIFQSIHEAMANLPDGQKLAYLIDQLPVFDSCLQVILTNKLFSTPSFFDSWKEGWQCSSIGQLRHAYTGIIDWILKNDLNLELREKLINVTAPNESALGIIDYENPSINVFTFRFDLDDILVARNLIQDIRAQTMEM